MQHLPLCFRSYIERRRARDENIDSIPLLAASIKNIGQTLQVIEADIVLLKNPVPPEMNCEPKMCFSTTLIDVKPAEPDIHYNEQYERIYS